MCRLLILPYHDNMIIIIYLESYEVQIDSIGKVQHLEEDSA